MQISEAPKEIIEVDMLTNDDQCLLRRTYILWGTFITISDVMRTYLEKVEEVEGSVAVTYVPVLFNKV